MSETATRLRYDIGLAAALSLQRVLSEAGASLSIRESEPRLRALQVMSRFADLRISYPDCIGAVIAKQAGASVFSLDNDFRILNLTVEP